MERCSAPDRRWGQILDELSQRDGLSAALLYDGGDTYHERGQGEGILYLKGLQW